MELSKQELSDIIRSNPGDFALYLLRDGALQPYYNSPGLPALSGMSAEEYDALTRQDASAVVLESDRAGVAGLLAGILAEPGSDIDFTYRIVHRRKDFIWIHAKARCIGTLEGLPVLMTVFLNTSSETEEHAALLNRSSVNVYVVDRRNAELLYANEPVLRTAKGGSSYCGCTCYAFLYGRSTPCARCPVEGIGGECGCAGEIYSPETDRWLRIDTDAINWFGRDAAAVYSFNITEEKRQQQSLEIDKLDLEKIIGNIPVGVGVFEIRDGVYTQVALNPYIYELLGVSAEAFSLRNKQMLEMVHPDDRTAVIEDMRALVQPGMHLERAFRCFRNGVCRWFRFEARTLDQNGTPVIFACLTDMTAEKEAENAVRQSRQIYESAVETAQLVVWQYDIRTHSILLTGTAAPVNAPAGGRLENVPASLLPYIDEADAPALLEMYREIDGGAPSASCEICCRFTPGEEPRCVRVTLTNTFDESGRPVTAYGIGQDVTARRLEEEKYVRLYRQLVEANPKALGTFRLNLTKNLCGGGQSPYPAILVLQNSGTADGYLDAVQSKIEDDAIRSAYRKRFTREKLLRAFRAGVTQLSLDFPIFSPDGRLVWVSGFLNMIQNPGTGDVEAITYALDITARKKSEAIIRRVTDENCDYIGLLDVRAHTIEFRNTSTAAGEARLHGKTDSDEYLRYAVSHTVAPEDRENILRCAAIDHLVAELAGGGTYTLTFCCPLKDGKARRKQLQYNWLNDARREILVIQTDITAAYEQAQQQLRRMEAALHAAEEANRAKSEFLSRISHDIRTPMNVIGSMTAFAFEDMADPEKLKKDLREIQTSNTFLLSLINDILDLSKIDSGRIELHPEPYPYADYIANIRSMFEPLCRQKGLRFLIEEGEIDGTVVTDRIRLNQIALNLLSNAVKYTPSGGTVTCRTAGTRLPDGRIDCLIEVSDTGIGMSGEFQKKMFEPFTQEAGSSRCAGQAGGTGLGLSIVKRIVDLMDGTITVRSEPGKGTDIAVRFAFPEAEDAAADSALLPAQSAADRPLHGRVLLAEDHPINAEIAQRLLAGFGLEVVWAHDGEMAVSLFSDEPAGTFAAVLMDIQMPRMNGCDAARAIRALPRRDAQTVPIIAMTADAYAEDVERCLRAGMNAHVAKPLDPKLLRRTLASLLP